MERTLQMGDFVGHQLMARLVPLLLATTAVLGVALLLDHLLARRVRAGLRLFLYLAVLLRALLPLDGANPLALLGRAPGARVMVDAAVSVTAGEAVAAPLCPALWLGSLYLAGVVVL